MELEQFKLTQTQTPNLEQDNLAQNQTLKNDLSAWYVSSQVQGLQNIKLAPYIEENRRNELLPELKNKTFQNVKKKKSNKILRFYLLFILCFYNTWWV